MASLAGSRAAITGKYLLRLPERIALGDGRRHISVNTSVEEYQQQKPSARSELSGKYQAAGRIMNLKRRSVTVARQRWRDSTQSVSGDLRRYVRGDIGDGRGGITRRSVGTGGIERRLGGEALGKVQNMPGRRGGRKVREYIYDRKSENECLWLQVCSAAMRKDEWRRGRRMKAVWELRSNAWDRVAWRKEVCLLYLPLPSVSILPSAHALPHIGSRACIED